MKAFDDFVKWSYVRYAGLALGVLGGILLLSCLGVISSASSLSSSASSIYSAFGGLSDLYASISNMSSTYAFNFLVLIILTIAIFLKMKTGGRMNYKPGYLFLGSIVVGLLCEGMISSIKNSAFNMFSSSMDSLASSILLLGFLMLLMGALQNAIDKGIPATDECMALEHIGARPAIVRCSYENIKITTPEDLVFAQAVIEARQY